MNENRVQQILAYEKKAMEICEEAMKEAEQLPHIAEQEAQAIIEKARREAEEEARQIVAQAHAQEECERILEQSEEKIKRTQSLAKTNFDRAVDYTLARVIGLDLH